MKVPPKVHYQTESEYRVHFEQVYCKGPITTFDGIPVYFRKCNFDHCMFESSQRNKNKDTFSTTRAERIDWIKETLQDPGAKLYVGWNKRKKRPNTNSRVALVYEDYVVVIKILKSKGGGLKAHFMTAYVADESIDKIKKMPRWRAR